jgi:hypothetical protein
MVLRDRWHVVSSASQTAESESEAGTGRTQGQMPRYILVFGVFEHFTLYSRKTYGLDAYLKIQDVKFGCGGNT